jgi:ribosome maturation protein Sdo1
MKLLGLSVVQLKVRGGQFEILCSPNTVQAFRSGHMKDIDDVVHCNQVFQCAAKGLVATTKQLCNAFRTDDMEKICKKILEEGEIQVCLPFMSTLEHIVTVEFCFTTWYLTSMH